MLQKLFFAIFTLAVVVRIVLALVFAPQVQNDQHIHFTTTLFTEPTSHGSYKSVTVHFTQGFSSLPLVLTLPVESELHYGQTVAVSGSIKVKALGNGQKLFVLSQPDIAVLSNQNSLLGVGFFLREHVQGLYEAVLPEKSAALLLGIVLGVKGNFPQNFLSNLQATGVMHVIAASGMNVTMVAGFLLGMFTIFLKRQWAVVLTIFGLLFYCMLSGFQASILRATIMLLFVLLAQLFGRQYSGLYGLSLAAGGMLLYNPLWIFDIGFQLSFASTIGILFIKALLPRVWFVGDDIGTTIAAQLATLPILFTAFGSYGVLSIIVNALILWTIPPLMVLGGVGGIVGLLYAPIGSVLILLCEPLLWFFENMVSFLGICIGR